MQPRIWSHAPAPSAAIRHAPGGFTSPRQPVLARVRTALQQAQLHQRQRVAVCRGRTHAEVFGDFDDPARVPLRAEAGEDRQAAQQRARQARVDRPDRHVPAQSRGLLRLDRGSVESVGDQRGNARRTAARGRAHHLVDLGGRQLDGDGDGLVFGHAAMLTHADECLKSVFLNIRDRRACVSA